MIVKISPPEGRDIKVISFDCYGTLVDWKRAVVDILGAVTRKYSLVVEPEELFRLFTGADRECIQKGYRTYREILADLTGRIAEKLNINLYGEDRNCLADGFDTWEVFDDTVGSLQELKKHFRLCVISNVDNDLFAITARKLGVELDYLVTAQQARSYKPAHNNFRLALEAFGIPREQVLHAAQSIYHDIVPANQLGILNAWVNRYRDPLPEKEGEQPDLVVPDLAHLVQALEPD
jgi:2-haloacid dehalogenase